MDDAQAALAKVEAEIEALGAQLNEVVEEIKGARERQDEAEVAQLRRKEEQLRRKEEQLRTEKEQLRAKELLLLQSAQGMLASVCCVPVRGYANLLCSFVQVTPARC